jgi:hypothetical protein
MTRWWDAMSNSALILIGATLLALVASVAGSKVEAADGLWLDGTRSSCSLICRAAGHQAWKAGYYRRKPGRTDYDFVICRVRADYPDRRYAGRPGFQQQSGSPNVCKVQGLKEKPDGAGSAWLANMDLVSDEVLWRYECLCTSPQGGTTAPPQPR